MCVTKDTRYKCGACNRKFTIKTGTFMQASHIPVQQWLYTIYIMNTNKKGISSIRLSEELGVTQKTAWYMSQKIRECFNYKPVLHGTVEMDETFIGGKEKNKHQSKKKGVHGTQGKIAVMGAISREEKQAVAYPVPTVNHNEVGTFLQKNVDADATLMADEAPSYDKYTQLRSNHSAKQYVDGMIHTNGIESFWATIKRAYVGTFHYWSKKHLHRYINEFVFRYNYRQRGNMIFINQVLKIGKNKVTTFKEIRA